MIERRGAEQVTKTATRTGLIPVFVVGLTIAAIVGMAVSWTSMGTDLDNNWAPAAVLVVLMTQGHARVRYRYREETEDLNLFEATLAIAFVAVLPADAALLAGIGTAIAVALQRITPLKSAFNIAQWMLSALCGATVFHWLADGTTTSDIAALLAGLATAYVVNQISLATVLYLVSGHPFGQGTEGSGRTIIVSRLFGAVTTISLGLLLASAYTWNSWLIVCAFAPLALLHWASKGYATALTDQARLGGLQQATHALSVSFDVDEAVPEFLARTRSSFEVARAELWLSLDGRLVRAYVDGTNLSAADTALFGAWLDSHLATSLLKGARTTLGESVTIPGLGQGIVVALRSGERLHGALCLLDRTGMEGFEEGELAVASALGNELVGFLERASLVDTVIEERTKLSRIVEQTSDGIATLATDGTILTWNSALETITGYSSEEMVGTTHLGLLRSRDDSGADVWLERWATTDLLPERIQVRNSAGENRWLSCSFTRAAHTGDEAEESLILVARDVTSAHELERLKDDFVAVVSHELRTPLVPIKGWAQMLLTRGDRLSPEQRRDALESIQAQAQRLERLVLNILEASRIEGGLEPIGSVVDVAQVAARVIDEMLPTSATHVVRLHGADKQLLALGQPVWVERAIANLLANAVKYAPGETTIDIALTQEDAEVVIRVADEGPGIPVAWRERIFERFERVPESRTQTGTGLGLYITRQLVTAMGGQIEVDSTVGSGTTFTVRLRAASVSVPPRDKQTSPRDAQTEPAHETTSQS